MRGLNPLDTVFSCFPSVFSWSSEKKEERKNNPMDQLASVSSNGRVPVVNHTVHLSADPVCWIKKKTAFGGCGPHCYAHEGRVLGEVVHNDTRTVHCEGLLLLLLLLQGCGRTVQELRCDGVTLLR